MKFPPILGKSQVYPAQRVLSFFSVLVRRIVFASRYAALTAMMLACAGTNAWADDAYPSRAVKIIVGFPAGGGVDSIARALAERLSTTLKQTFIIENKPGAAGTIAADIAAREKPDGYTLYFSETAFLIAQNVMSSLKVNATDDFTPVGSIAKLPLTLTVNPKLPVKTTQELIDLLKAHPGKFSYGSAGVGTPHHFMFEMFLQSAHVSATHVPYKGGAPMVPDLIEGRIEIGMLSSAVAAPHVDSGRLRALAVTTRERVSNMPSVPPLADTIPGFDAASSFFMLAPKGTPEYVINKLNSAMRPAVESESFKTLLLTQGALAYTGTPAELASSIVQETKRWQQIATAAGIAKQ